MEERGRAAARRLCLLNPFYIHEDIYNLANSTLGSVRLDCSERTFYLTFLEIICGSTCLQLKCQQMFGSGSVSSSPPPLGGEHQKGRIDQRRESETADASIEKKKKPERDRGAPRTSGDGAGAERRD